jgi:hypothetical protein
MSLKKQRIMKRALDAQYTFPARLIGFKIIIQNLPRTPELSRYAYISWLIFIAKFFLIKLQ